MQKQKKSVQDQVRDTNPEFVESVQSLGVDELNNRLAQCAKDAEAVQDAKEADETLAQALLEASELGAPYRESKKAIKLKIRYLVEIIKERS